MFMHKSKKGFTIVELVIVIAVIAILAAVLIPTFSNLVKKANQSADIQAARQMNTVLAAAQATGTLVEEGNDAQTSVNIFKALVDSGYKYEFDTYYEKYSFGYVVEGGKAVIVLVEDNKVAFPEANAGATEYKNFFTAVENAEDLVSAFETGYVMLKKDAVFTEAIGISNDVTIVGHNKILNDDKMTDDRGANSAVNIKDIVAGEDVSVNMSGIAIENPDDAYARGLNFSNVKGDLEVVLDNVNITSHYYAINTTSSNTGNVKVVIKDSTISGWAALNVWSKVDITFENCTLIGNDVSTDNRFATIVINADAAGSNLTFKNCTIEANSPAGNSDMRILDVRCDATVTFEGCTFKVDGNTVTNPTQIVDDGVTATITVK